MAGAGVLPWPTVFKQKFILLLGTFTDVSWLAVERTVLPPQAWCPAWGPPSRGTLTPPEASVFRLFIPRGLMLISNTQWRRTNIGLIDAFSGTSCAPVRRLPGCSTAPQSPAQARGGGPLEVGRRLEVNRVQPPPSQVPTLEPSGTEDRHPLSPQGSL